MSESKNDVADANSVLTMPLAQSAVRQPNLSPPNPHGDDESRDDSIEVEVMTPAGSPGTVKLDSRTLLDNPTPFWVLGSKLKVMPTNLRRGMIVKIRNSSHDKAVASSDVQASSVDYMNNERDINKDRAWLVVHHRLFHFDVRPVYIHDKTTLRNIPQSAKVIHLKVRMRIIERPARCIERIAAKVAEDNNLQIDTTKEDFELSYGEKFCVAEEFFKDMKDGCEVIAEVDLDELECTLEHERERRRIQREEETGDQD